MIEAKAVEKLWNVAEALTGEGWSCDYIRVDIGMATFFALGAYRDGAHHVILSDELLPALLELRRQTAKSFPIAPSSVFGPLPFAE